MVGLPARGKTYISKKLTRYLNWIGMPTKGMPRTYEYKGVFPNSHRATRRSLREATLASDLMVPLPVPCCSLQCRRVPQGGGQELQLLRLLQA